MYFQFFTLYDFISVDSFMIKMNAYCRLSTAPKIPIVWTISECLCAFQFDQAVSFMHNKISLIFSCHMLVLWPLCESGVCTRVLKTDGYRICDQVVSEKCLHPSIFLVLLSVLVHQFGSRGLEISNLGSGSGLLADAPRPNKLGSPIHH